jgi:beta-lactamase superfamily II metal-dependent hydrolase
MLADSGYIGANPQPWLAALTPSLVLTSVEGGNQRGIPSPRLLQTLDGLTILRTDLHGRVTLSSDGSHFWAEVERQPSAPPGNEATP